MSGYRTVLRLWTAAVLVGCTLAASAATDTGKPKLKMFDYRSNPKGLWKMELLESSDPKLMANAKTLSETAICMDAALEMAEGVKPTRSNCTQSVLKDTVSEARIEKHCPDTGTTTMTMTRESENTILFETIEKGKAGVISTMRGRYHYVGPCDPADGLMKVDKDSEICQRARAEAAAGPEAMCEGLDGAQKAECLQRSAAALEKSRKLCE
jgi:hypothetical protein